MQFLINKRRKRFPGPSSWKKWKEDKNFQKPEKMRILSKKIAKFEIFKIKNQIEENFTKIFSNLLSNPWLEFLAAGTRTIWIMTINLQKIREKLKVLSKMLNFMIAKTWKPFHNH